MGRLQRFELSGPLGQGGMGTVYRARDPVLERDVAIKVLAVPSGALPSVSAGDTIDLRRDAPATGDDPLSEARIMARLSHPNVLPVHEVGIADDSLFIVMELIEGVNLEEWLTTPRTTLQIVETFAQAARGLQAAHERGIVHRDFKPSNVLVGTDGRVRVADFGLSKLTAPSAARVKIDDGRGTPRYMAPELWRRESATTRSDVFAFCTALAEALGDRPVSAALRTALVSGCAEDPEARCDLATVIAAIEERERPRRARWLIGGTGAVLALGLGAVALFGGDAPTCAYEPSLLAGRWDDARRAALRAAIANPEQREENEALVTALDQRGRGLADALRDTCSARRDGKLDAAAASAHGSCLARRVFELGAVVDEIIAAKPGLADALGHVVAIGEPTECSELVAPALPTDPKAAIALYARYAKLPYVPLAERGAAAASLERDATAAGELELAVRAAGALASAESLRGRPDAADEALERMHRAAVDLRNASLATFALSVRSSNAEYFRSDAQAAHSLAELAVDLAKNPTVTPRARARAYWALGVAQRDRGELPAAVVSLRTALDAQSKVGSPDPNTESFMREPLVTTLRRMDGKLPQALAAARDYEKYARRWFGEHGHNYAVALDSLAVTLQNDGDWPAALPYFRKALEVEIEAEGPDGSHTTRQRLDLARELINESFDEAREQLDIVLAHVEHDETLRGIRWDALELSGYAEFSVGHFDLGVRRFDEAIEGFIELHGKSSVDTERARYIAAGLQIELGHLDDAERRLATLEQSYRTHPDDSYLWMSWLETDKATIARLRGQLPQAESLARAALAALQERHAPPIYLVDTMHELSTCLIDEHRYEEARPFVEQTRKLVAASHGTAEQVASVDLLSAEIEAGLGHRDAARAQAERVRDVLERNPGEIEDGKRVAALLARTAPPAPSRANLPHHESSANPR